MKTAIQIINKCYEKQEPLLCLGKLDLETLPEIIKTCSHIHAFCCDNNPKLSFDFEIFNSFKHLGIINCKNTLNATKNINKERFNFCILTRGSFHSIRTLFGELVQNPCIENRPKVNPTPITDEPKVNPIPIIDEPIVDPTPITEESKVIPIPIIDDPSRVLTTLDVREPKVDPKPITKNPKVDPNPQNVLEDKIINTLYNQLGIQYRTCASDQTYLEVKLKTLSRTQQSQDYIVLLKKVVDKFNKANNTAYNYRYEYEETTKETRVFHLYINLL